jgi:hypothetical protein
MNIIEPGIRNLATAKDVLLTPYGLDEALLSRTLAEIFTHRIDYADLYFQATRSEAWSLEGPRLPTRTICRPRPFARPRSPPARSPRPAAASRRSRLPLR